MKKSIISLLICTLMGHFTKAQIANGSLAPNFSGVDLDGNTYNLHQILGSGKGVIIDFSTAWCGPCITMHRTHFFDVIYRNYGPQGTNELVVLFLEADNSTDLADLQGTGDYTVGDFTACTDLPILDNMEAAANSFQIPSYPSFFVINPSDSSTRYFSIFNHNAIFSHLVNNGMIGQSQADAGVGYLCDEKLTQYICSEANTFVPQFDLYNFGASALTSLNFEIFVNGVFHSSQNWSGNLASFNSEAIVLNPIPVSGASDVRVVINQIGDGNLNNNKVEFNVQLSNVTTENEVTVEIKTDHLGAETYWQITDDGGNIVESGGNPWVGTNNIGIGFGANAPQTPQGSYQSNQTYTKVVGLQTAKCYDFIITDYYGGGIDRDLGGYKVMDHQGNVIFSGDEFESIVTHSFLSVGVTGLNNSLAESNIQLYPNPAQNQLNLDITLTQAEITIFDLYGRQVYQAEWNQKPIAISHLSGGLYFLKIAAENNTWSKSFIKE